MPLAPRIYATDPEITPRVIIIVGLVAIPFAVLSELAVDHPRFWEKLMPLHWFPRHRVVRRGETNRQ